MEETLSLDEMQTLVDRLRTGSGILFNIIQNVGELHDENEDGSCAGCGEIYPCPTMQVVLSHLVYEPLAEESAEESAEETA